MITLTPKGRLVSSRVLSMRSWTRSGDAPLTPRTPKPPASETAATSSGPATDPMPAERIGTSILSASQSGVRSPTTSADYLSDQATRPAHWSRNRSCRRGRSCCRSGSRHHRLGLIRLLEAGRMLGRRVNGEQLQRFVVRAGQVVLHVGGNADGMALLDRVATAFQGCPTFAVDHVEQPVHGVGLRARSRSRAPATSAPAGCAGR